MEWMLAHPWMTFFVASVLASNITLAIKWHRKPDAEDE